MTTRESARAFIARKSAEWESPRHQTVKVKDVGRKARLVWTREAWTWHVQHNAPQKVLVIERLRLTRVEGRKAYSGGSKPGEIEYRFGYFRVGRIGRAAGRWVWGQFSPLIPHEDLAVLLEKAHTEGTLLS